MVVAHELELCRVSSAWGNVGRRHYEAATLGEGGGFILPVSRPPRWRSEAYCLSALHAVGVHDADGGVYVEDTNDVER